MDDQDLKILKANLGQKGALGDLNGDGIVDEQDLAILRAAFGSRPGPTGLGRTFSPCNNAGVPVSTGNVRATWAGTSDTLDASVPLCAPHSGKTSPAYKVRVASKLGGYATANWL